MSKTIVLKNGIIFDGVHEELIRGKCLIIQNGRLQALREETENFESAYVVDLNGKFVSPGFTDCHMHMLLEEVAPNKNLAMTTQSAGGELYPNADSAVAFMGVGNCRKMLKAGFTTVMDGGGRNFVDCALREAIQKGHVLGPNYQVSGKQLTTNHAHFIGFSTEPYGPYGMRKAVRDLMWWSVDFVKMQLSPPIRIVGRKPNATDFTMDEIRSAVDEAHNYGIPVHAHLRGAKAVKNFLDAGGDVVVHGTGMDDEGIEMMLKGNHILLPTLMSPSPRPSKEEVNAKPQTVLDLLEKTAEVHWESAKRAYRAGVTMAFSSDCGTLGNHIGTNGIEFQNLVDIGMRPVEALRAATSVAAKVTGKEHSQGQIKEGYVADLVVLDGNPFKDIRATANVEMTILNGKIVYNREWGEAST